MNKFDIVIIGGGTAGVSCAWNAGRLGLKTLLVESNSFLGGSITSSLVIPAMKVTKNAINTDFFNELYNKLYNMKGAITYCDGNTGWFNPELTKIALDDLMLSVNVKVMLNCTVNNIANKNNLLSLYIESIHGDNNFVYKSNLLLEPIETKYLIDATGDAKICKKLNVEFLENLENETQPNSLRFIMSGVDTEAFSKWLLEFDTDRNVTTSCCVDGNTYLSTAYTWDSDKWALKPLFERAITDGVLTSEDCNYFQLFSVAGTPDSIAFNAPRLIKNSDDVSLAYINGRQSIYRLSEFCKKYLLGFERAHISSIANSLGVRVSSRVRGKYIYKYDDIVQGNTFKNPVVVSDYPVDIHSNQKDTSILEKVNKEYQLPIESLMVDGYDNLFVIGRCISADFKAQAALRVIPSCFSMGEGLAKYLAKQ